ncbi:MAG: adenylosuccinate lyase [Candidatus Lokiarchaeota archaeon]|nr:adenylosuccinate lyase [Candidatus Lokiarchaeota archaeon]
MNHKFIHPIETRYRTSMANIFTDEKKLENWLKIEAVLANVHAKLENIPKEAAKEIIKKASLEFVKIERVNEIEKEIHHDLMAMVKCLAEQCEGNAGKYIHLGATSYDIEDTATALQLKEGLVVLESSLIELLKELVNHTENKKELVCIGRTHGQQAIPTTYGMRFGVWAYEIDRHLERLKQIKERISFGKMSGAVGTMASFGEKGIIIQNEVMKELNLNSVLIANQVVQRDRHAEVIFLTSLIGQTLAKIARENRILQRNEIAEMFEPFKKKQVGSSTMPHKRNPHKSERICSLARILKSNTIVALDNIVLEDERDLTNSASERVIFSENFVFLDFMIHQLIQNLKGLEFNKNNIEKNLNLTKGACLAERIMVELVNKGIGRQEAHELLRQTAIKARNEDLFMKDILNNDKTINERFTKEEIDELFNPYKYIGKAVNQLENLVKIIKNKYNF